MNPVREISDPDLLVYWAQDDTAEQDLSHARLLGSFSANKPFLLPAPQQGGLLILYSFAHQVIVDKAKIKGLP